MNGFSFSAYVKKQRCIASDSTIIPVLNSKIQQTNLLYGHISALKTVYPSSHKIVSLYE
jgi:hypothetical protein